MFRFRHYTQPDEYPAFVKIATSTNDILELDGFVVTITDSKSCNINSKKGGEKSMEKTTIRVAKKGFETFYEAVMSKRESFARDKEVAIQEAIEEVNARFAKDEKTLENCYLEVTEEQEVEVPDAVVEETEVAETEPQPEVADSLY